MHQTRSEVTMRVPIPRKGTKYVARPISNIKNSVSVLVAIRDMLKLARTKKEVHEMLKQKSIKINGRTVFDYHDSIKPFSILEADKKYMLNLTTNGRFIFKETPNANDRPCKVINKRLVRNGKIQINLNDGSNAITKDKINVHDTVYLDLENKIKEHVPFEKGKTVFIISGKSIGQEGVIEHVEGNFAAIKIKDKIHRLKKQGVMTV